MASTICTGYYRLFVLFFVLVAIAPQVIAAEEPSVPPKFVLEWGEEGTEPGQFKVPIGIAVTSAGEVLVTDFYNARVQRFSAEGKHLATFEVLPNPGALALDGDGNLYMSHFTAMKRDEEKKPDRVSVYSPQGKLLRQWGKTGTGDGEFDYPGGIAITRDVRVYVADQTNRRIQVFDREGKFLLKWGEYGVKEGQFGGNVSAKSRVGGPQFVAIDNEGKVYTTEGSLGRIQQFTADGKFVRAWGDNEDKPGSFGGAFDGVKGHLQGPIGICFDKGGQLWISAASGRVQQFTPDGKFLRLLGSGLGDQPGQFHVPHSMAPDGHGHLYIVDSLNHRVQKFAIAP